jgi:hypothetical protein
MGASAAGEGASSTSTWYAPPELQTSNQPGLLGRLIPPCLHNMGAVSPSSHRVGQLFSAALLRRSKVLDHLNGRAQFATAAGSSKSNQRLSGDAIWGAHRCNYIHGQFGGIFFAPQVPPPPRCTPVVISTKLTSRLSLAPCCTGQPSFGHIQAAPRRALLPLDSIRRRYCLAGYRTNIIRTGTKSLRGSRQALSRRGPHAPRQTRSPRQRSHRK